MKEYNYNYVDTYLLFACAILLVGTLRTTNLYNSAHEVLLIDLCFGLWFIIHAWIHQKASFRFNLTLVLGLIIIAISFFSGALSGYRFINMVIDISRPTLFFLIYTVFRNSTATQIQAQLPSLARGRLLLSCVLISLTAFAVVYMTRERLYLSATDITYVFLLMVFWIHSRKSISLLIAVLLLIGGRRGALLGFIGAFLSTLSQLRYLAPLLICLPWLVVICAPILVFDNPAREFLGSLGTVNKFLANYKVASAASDGSWIDMIFRMFDDRFSEIISALNVVSSSWLSIILGKGAGFEYEVHYPIRNVAPQLVRGVHFSPVGIYAQFGILGLVIIYSFFAKIVIRALKILHENSDSIFTLSAFFVIAYFIDSFTAFSIFLSPLFAICCGIVMNPTSLRWENS